MKKTMAAKAYEKPHVAFAVRKVIGEARASSLDRAAAQQCSHWMIPINGRWKGDWEADQRKNQ